MLISLYSLCDVVLIGVLALILYYEKFYNTHPNELETAYGNVTKWFVFFCTQDLIWGYCAESGFGGRDLFILMSAVFHLSTILTTYQWLKFVLLYLGESEKRNKLVLNVVRVLLVLQVGFLIANHFNNMIFVITEDNVYEYGPFWWVVFATYYSVYAGIWLHSVIAFFKAGTERKARYRATVAFAAPVVIAGILQVIDAYGPYTSIGYFFACFIAHMFVVSEARHRLESYEYQKELESQKLKSEIDELTGLINRKGYEDNLREFPSVPPEENFVYASIDANGLKNINDTYGHDVGDETLKGAAQCIKTSIGSYGRVYRIGGDEFAAIFFTSPEKVKDIKKDLEEQCAKWKGSMGQELSLSAGFVTKKEMPMSTVIEMSKVADKRMYAAKSNYYMSKGVDRRSQQSAFLALANSYDKLAKVNLTDDTYQLLKVRDDEKDEEASATTSWTYYLRKLYVVHSEDRMDFLAKTNSEFLRKYYAEGNETLKVIYRRKSGDDYHRVVLEVVKADDYSDERQTVYIFVKDIDGML